ncbi:hypothetical protein C6503_26800 [Candidatus Poribacteria bacterium]|nr:MAG: hypothetical protein C6503_26800 [Candidatus Poribacteria bacterium]
MISVRTLTITGIVILLLCAGLFFYTEYRNQKFAEQLPTLQSKQVAVETVVDKTSEPINGMTPNSHASQAIQRNVETPEVYTPIADVQKHSAARQTETEFSAEDTESRSQTEIDTVFDDAFAFFDDFSVFGSINLEATRIELEELLREMHGNDPRISELLGYWDTTSSILSLRTEYNQTGASDAYLREQIFGMKPTEVLPKTLELGVELIQPSEAIATKRGEWLQDWVELMDKAEMAHFAAGLAKEAVDNNEITAQEAEGFVEEVSGLDVEVIEE